MKGRLTVSSSGHRVYQPPQTGNTSQLFKTQNKLLQHTIIIQLKKEEMEGMYMETERKSFNISPCFKKRSLDNTDHFYCFEYCYG